MGEGHDIMVYFVDVFILIFHNVICWIVGLWKRLGYNVESK